MTLDFTLLKDNNLVFLVGLGPEISFKVSLSTTSITPHYQILVFHPVFDILFCVLINL
jgi:hypothetical protein